MRQLSETQQTDLNFFLLRKQQLMDSRANSGIEKIWKQADADYEPHELGAPKKKVLVENERTEVSTYVNLNKDQWRSKQASNDPYIKIQSAIAILFDRNPEALFDPAARRFEANTILMDKLYHRTWLDTKINSKAQLRQFIFNLSKYGFSVARRYYRKEMRKDLEVIKEFDVKSNKFTYEKKDIIDFDDVYFENMRVWDCWIDDMARPDDRYSRRDWMWRKTYDKFKFEELLKITESTAELSLFSFSSGTEVDDTNPVNSNERITSEDLITVYFYENRQKNKFIIEAGGQLIATTPIPREDQELSLVDTYWTLRSDESPYGIGINEIMRSNKVLKDRVKNMTMDQVVLSIYKMFFYANSEQIDDEGGESVSIEPGKGKKVIDPKNITWLDIPGPGRDAYEGLKLIDEDIDQDTGINKTLQGVITGKTAFEIEQAKEGALKRLSTPLRNIKAALEWDALLCVNLIQMVYSIPRVYKIVDPELIAHYVSEINDDKELYFVEEDGTFNALDYREFQLSLEQTPDGIISSEEKQFFMVKPSHLDWSGQITIRVESMIEMSKSMERSTKLEMSNILLPLIGQMAAAPQMIQIYIKPVKQILKLYNENPQDWLPDEWLAGAFMNSMNPMMGQPPAPGQSDQAQIAPPQEAQTIVPSSDLTGQTNLSGSVASQSQTISPV